nr:integrase, catalytic region, zinc finger, CCHC-type, peptidase aspartic, catalytic [Tanacetum cinerariifolium]
MSTQQDIYAAGFENRPPMLNKENYIPWSSRLLRYVKSRPNGKLIHNSIINGPYVRRMIPEPGDPNRKVYVNETFYVHTDDELSENELKEIEADDQAIQTILLGLPEDIYAAVDKVDDLKAKRLARTQDPLALMATSNNPYTFPVLHQDQPSFNQNYMQQPMPNLEDITNPTTSMTMALALMAKAFKLNYSTPTDNNQRISSNLRNRQIAQPGMNMGQDRQMQMVGGNGGNQFRQHAGQNVRNLNGYNDVQNVENQVIHNAVQNPNRNGNLVAAHDEGNASGHNGNQIRCYNCRGLGYFARNCTVKPRRRDAAYLQTQLLIAQKEEAGIQLQAEEFDLMAAAADLDEIEEVNANCILMANLQQASTSGTQTNKAPVYDSDGSAEFLGTVRFGNDHVASILGFGDLQWGNILITRVYFVEGVGHNVFSVGQFCDSDLENDREDIGKLGAKGDISFFIGYSADSCAYRVFNRRTKKIIKTMNASFDELSAMDFEQRSSKPGLQSMTSGKLSSGLDLTYAPSTIITQQPTEGELDLLFEAMYDDYIGGQPSTAPRTVPVAQAHQVRQTLTTSTTIANTAPTPTNSSSQATNFPNTSQDVDGLNSQQQYAQQQGNHAPIQPEIVADNIPNAMFDANTFVNPFATPSTSAAESSSSQYVDPSNMHTFYQPYPHEFQWTKDHPLEQGIGEPS